MSAFSTVNPDLQVIWDSTSLQSVMTCPYRYKLQHLDGWQPKETSPDLAFGIYYASAIERFWKLRLDGVTKDAAILDVVRWLLSTTWRNGNPWGGLYEDMWRCAGTNKYKNKKGNAAKCPFSHKGEFFPMPNPEPCGECGSATEVHHIYVPHHKYKHRISLLRLFIGWADTLTTEDLADGIHPYTFPDGTKAVELSFTVPLAAVAYTGETYGLAGHFDWIAEYGSGELAEHFPTDNKTTKNSLTEQFWHGYAPHVQIDNYDMTASVLFPDLNVRGVMIDAAQVLVDSVAFSRRQFYKSDEQREEHLRDILFWINQAEGYAKSGHWPQNKTACKLCPFNKICQRKPEERETWLKMEFEKRPRWDPTVER